MFKWLQQLNGKYKKRGDYQPALTQVDEDNRAVV